MELTLPQTIDAPQDNFPFPAPFILSSVERDWSRFQPNKDAAIVYIKRRHLEENLKTIANDVGMDEAEQKKFLDWWCCPKGEEIRAEGDPYFDIRYRATNWMERRMEQMNDTQKSRVEKYEESARQFFGAGQTIPSTGREPRGFGYADIPDEQ